VGSQVRKRKKAAVAVDEPRPSKPFAIVLSAAALAGCCSILFNAFFNQPATLSAGQGVALQDGGINVAASAPKESRTITLKYEALIEDIQRELLSTGHFKGLVDGVTGPKTRVAIEAYQRDNKMDVTGEASKALLEHIQYTRKVNQAAEFTGSVAPAKVEKKPIVAPLAELPKPAPKPQANGDNAIVKLQVRLAALGYDPGSRSGELDEGTRSAILIFEMDNGLAMEGKISKTLLSAIKSAEAKKKP
jgi:peptidoglycan hydrolase-like protein with peptidoglycan-binding domain